MLGWRLAAAACSCEHTLQLSVAPPARARISVRNLESSVLGEKHAGNPVHVCIQSPYKISTPDPQIVPEPRTKPTAHEAGGDRTGTDNLLAARRRTHCPAPTQITVRTLDSSITSETSYQKPLLFHLLFIGSPQQFIC